VLLIVALRLTSTSEILEGEFDRNDRGFCGDYDGDRDYGDRDGGERDDRDGGGCDRDCDNDNEGDGGGDGDGDGGW
jgi:hypothetical protein